MRFPVQCVVLMMVPLLMTACDRKQQKAQLPPLAPPEAATIPPPSNAPPPPVETIPTQPTQKAPTPPEPVEQPAKRKKKPKPADTTQQAAIATPNPEVSAIGQLSSGDPAEVRRQTVNSIASIEQGLQKIDPKFNDSEQKTADHIRDFIKQAKAALSTGDVDGAHTLADKARVLLNKLVNK